MSPADVLHLQRTVGNRAVGRLLSRPAIQRQGGYIPAGDGPYGHEFSDGPSTAGAAFGQPLKNALYDLNANRNITAEQHDLVNIDDDDDDTMLTRDRAVIAEVDHVYPAALGGSSSHRNAQIISAESNNYKSATYPTDGDWSGGVQVLMGHQVNATGMLRGQHVQFNVPAYQRFQVAGSGAGAQIDTSDYTYNVTLYQQHPVTGALVPQGTQMAQGPADLSPAEARTLGILPATIPDPRQ